MSGRSLLGSLFRYESIVEYLCSLSLVLWLYLPKCNLIPTFCLHLVAQAVLRTFELYRSQLSTHDTRKHCSAGWKFQRKLCAVTSTGWVGPVHQFVSGMRGTVEPA